MNNQINLTKVDRFPDGQGGFLYGAGYIVEARIEGRLFKEAVFQSHKHTERELLKQLGRKIAEMGILISRQAEIGFKRD